MARAKHTYRKAFQHQFQAVQSADGFAKMGNIDKPGPAKAWVQEEEGTFYVYVELEGEVDAVDLFDATGYERVT